MVQQHVVKTRTARGAAQNGKPQTTMDAMQIRYDVGSPSKFLPDIGTSGPAKPPPDSFPQTPPDQPFQGIRMAEAEARSVPSPSPGGRATPEPSEEAAARRSPPRSPAGSGLASLSSPDRMIRASPALRTSSPAVTASSKVGARPGAAGNGGSLRPNTVPHKVTDSQPMSKSLFPSGGAYSTDNDPKGATHPKTQNQNQNQHSYKSGSATSRPFSPTGPNVSRPFSSQSNHTSHPTSITERAPRSPKGGEDDKDRYSGSEYRFFLPSRALDTAGFNGDSELNTRHFDIFCDWDVGENQDTSELAPAVKFHRQYYTWHLQDRKDSSTVQLGQTTWQEFLKYGSVAIEHLAAWCLALRPRSIHDYKPLLVLLQGVLKVVLAKELDMYSSEMMRMRREMLEDAQLIQQMNAELLNMKKKAQMHHWKTVVNTFSDTTERRLAEMRAMAESQAREDAERQRILVESNAAKEAMIYKQEEELKELRVLSKKQREDLKDKDTMLFSARDKIRTLERHMEDLATKLQGSHVKLDALSQDMDFQLMSKDMDAKARRKSRLHLGMKKIAMQTQIDNLKGEQDTIKSTINTSFFNWAAFRPVVEMQWAAVLVCGQASASVPWEGTLVLPRSSRLPNDTHVVEVPGGSVITTPRGQRDHNVALPAFTKLAFPGNDGHQADGAEYQVWPVSVPGGTSIIIPTEDLPAMVSLIVGPGTIIYSPNAQDDVDGGHDGSDEGNSGNIQTIPRGGLTRAKCLAGSTLVSPMGIRSTYHIPSGCTYIFPQGQKQSITVPCGSTAILKDGGYSLVIVPSCTTIALPSYEAWSEDAEEMTDAESTTSPTARPQRAAGEAPSKERLCLMQTEQPDCCVACPGGTEILAPTSCPYPSGKFKVTVPANTQVNGPLDEFGVPEKKSTWRAGTLPHTGTVVPGSRILLPTPFANITPRLLAERMKQLGPEACAAALGSLEPKLAAAALVESNISPALAGEILTVARSAAAAQIVRRIDPLGFRVILEYMNRDIVAAIMAVFNPTHRTDLLEQVCANDRDEGMLLARLEDASSNVAKASQLLASDGPIRRVVDALLVLDPPVMSKLIASTQANKAAYVLSRMSGRLAGGDNAIECAEQLSLMARFIKQISTRYNHHDIKRARLLEDLALCKTESSLFRDAVRIMCHLKEAYGIRCTLTRMPTEDSSRPKKKPKLQKSKSMPKSTRQRNHGVVRSNHEMKLAAKVAKDAADKMEILFSMEEVQWSSLPVPGQTFTEEMVASGLAVHMDPKILQDAQQEALDVDQPLFRGVLLVVPVVLSDGTPWGTLSHINRNSASQVVLGGLGMPATNSVPKACESLEQMARAIGMAMENIARVTKEHCDELNALKDAEGYAFDLSFEDGPDSTAPQKKKGLTQEQAELDLQSYTYWRRRASKNLSAQWTLDSFEELQAAAAEAVPMDVQLLMTVLFLTLEVGVGGFKDFLGPSLHSIPSSEDALARLWKYTKSLIEVNPDDPSNVPRLMQRASKGLSQASGFLPEDVADLALRTSCVARIMGRTDLKLISTHSNLSTQVLDWCYVQFKITDMQVRLGKRQAAREAKLQAQKEAEQEAASPDTSPTARTFPAPGGRLRSVDEDP